MATKKSDPGRREEIEQWLEEKGVRWTYQTDVPVSQFDLKKGLRNQARINQVLNDTVVETYVEAMKRGDSFPAVLAYKDGSKYVTIDGNHRLAAADIAGCVIDVYVIAADTDPTVIMLMTYEANAKHGLPNAVDERLRHAVFMIENAGASQESAAASLNLPKSAVSRAWQKHKADERSQAVGLLPREWEQLNPSTRIRIGSVQNDEIFSRMADLAYRAGLTADETDAAVRQINGTRSYNEQLKSVESLTDMYRSRVQASGGGVIKASRTMGPRRHLVMSMGHIAVVKAKMDSLVQGVTLLESEEMAIRIEGAAEVLLHTAELIRKQAKELS